MKLSAPIAGSSYRVTSTVGDFAEMILDPLGGHVTQERRVVLSKAITEMLDMLPLSPVRE